MRPLGAAFLLAGVLAALGWAAREPLAAAEQQEDVIHLRNGDRVSGRLLSETPRAFRLQTAFGRLTIPRARVARLVRADGTEETFSAWDTPSPSPPPAARTTEPTLAVTLTGRSFWYAWRSQEAPATPALRLQLEVDDEIVAGYEDARPDPSDYRGAVLNAFKFDDVTVAPGEGASPRPPEVTPGRIDLRVALPLALAGPRRVRFSYQVAGADGAWVRVTTAEIPVELVPEAETPVEVHQEPGQMDFGGLLRRRMRRAETFRLELAGASPRAPSPAP